MSVISLRRRYRHLRAPRPQVATAPVETLAEMQIRSLLVRARSRELCEALQRTIELIRHEGRT